MKIDEIMQLPDVVERSDMYFEHEAKFKQQLKDLAKVRSNCVVLDLRGQDPIYAGNRFMIYALFPQCNISIHVIDGFRKQMVECAGTIQGSGWALASWEPMAGRLVVQQVHDHQGEHGQGTVPLLAIDAWEHAYYLQYENRKPEYLDAIWNVISWPDVERRYEAARSADIVLA